MPPRTFVAPRGRAALSAALVLIAAACSAEQPPTATTAATGAVASARATAVPTPTPSPTPDPTPRFTNPPDAALAALLPATVAGLPLVVAPVDTFALTPGDVGLAFGELGIRFGSLAIAYVEQPRLTLYAVRVDGGTVTNENLAPHLATAGRYLGIAGLMPEPWELTTVGGHEVWTRPGDRATAAGTVLYVWAADDLVFLLIGVDDAVNQALVAALPGVPPPTPSPVPTASSRTPPASPSPGE
jgi:hypothetical protein